MTDKINENASKLTMKFDAFSRLARAIWSGEYEKREKNPFIVGDDIAVSGDEMCCYLFSDGEAYLIDDMELCKLVSEASA